jgi:hypothetical protein
MINNNLSFEFKCNQRWDALVFLDGKKMCMNCNKRVFDLTNHNKHQIIDLVKQNNNTLCGYFFADQLIEPKNTRQPFNIKIALAGIAAFLAFSSLKASAQTKDSLKTEQHIDNSPTNTIVTDSSLTANNQCVVIDPISAGDKSIKRKKAFMRIGSRYFYTTNRFPFIISRRRHMGRICNAAF